MAAVQPPLYIAVNGQVGADELGLPFRDLFGEGVLLSADLKVTQRAAGANMSVDVAAGSCWVQGDDSATAQPTYRCRNDAAVNAAVSGADATNPRIDRVIAEVLDSAFSGVSLLWRLRVITGTPTAGATLANLTGAGAVPNNALLLANVLVPAASGSVIDANIADVRPFAIVGGGLAISGAKPIADALLSASSASIDFQNIPDNFRHLLFVSQLRTDRAVAVENTFLRFNNDVAANYRVQLLTVSNAAATAVQSLAATSLHGGDVQGASATAGSFSAHFIFIPHYRGGNHKSIFGGGGGASAAGGADFLLCAGSWASAVAVNRLTLIPAVGPNFVAGSRATLYGLP